MAYARRDKEALERLGAKVRELRLEKGYSQENLGLDCDLSQTYISEVEAGKRNVSALNLRAIARSLGVPAASLLEDFD